MVPSRISFLTAAGKTEKPMGMLPKQCDPCKLGLAKFNEPVEIQPIAVQGIYHKVGIDMIGPIQTSESGNRYIITAVDYMSKNIEQQLLPTKAPKPQQTSSAETLSAGMVRL